MGHQSQDQSKVEGIIMALWRDNVDAEQGMQKNDIQPQNNLSALG